MGNRRFLAAFLLIFSVRRGFVRLRSWPSWSRAERIVDGLLASRRPSMTEMESRFSYERSALALLLILVAAGVGLAQTTFTDPQGRFVIDLPEGWKNLPFKPAPTNRDAVSIFEGDGVSFLIGFSPGVDDPGKLVEQTAYPLRHLEIYLDGGLSGLSVNGHEARWGVLRTRLDPGMVILCGSVALGRDGAYLSFTTRLEKPASLRAKVEWSFRTLRLPGEIVSPAGEAKPVDAPSWLTVPAIVAQKKINSGDIELRTSRFAEAIRYYSEAIATDPRAVEAYFKRAWAYLGGAEKADSDRALADADKALELDPAYKLAHFARGKAYLRKARAAQEAKKPNESAGLFDKALADLTLSRGADFNAIKLFPNYYFFQDPPELELLVDIGHAHFGKGDLDLALAAYSSAYERTAGSSYGFRMEGSLTTLFNEYSRQKRTFDVGDAPWTLVLLGRVHQEGLPDLAIRCLSRALGLTQDKGLTYDAYLSRSVAYAQKGNFANAIADADAAIGIYDFTSSYVNRAKIYEMKGDYGSAVNDYSVAIGAQRKDVRKSEKIAVSNLTVGSEKYTLANLYWDRARLYILAESWGKAIADYKTMMGMLKPDAAKPLAAIYRQIAWVYEVGKGDKKKADEYSRKAQALDPQIKK
jgi:tetratricopeptide (TPR) repeat protein